MSVSVSSPSMPKRAGSTQQEATALQGSPQTEAPGTNGAEGTCGGSDFFTHLWIAGKAGFPMGHVVVLAVHAWEDQEAPGSVEPQAWRSRATPAYPRCGARPLA